MRLKLHLVIAIVCTIFVMSLSACGQQNTVTGSEGLTPTKTPGKVRSVAKKDLEKYVNSLYTLKTVFENHHVKFLSSSSNENEGFLEIRRIGDHTKSLSDDEIAALKQSIFEAVGSEFPLKISVYTIGEQPGMTGNVTAIDEKGRFLIVSSDKFLDKEKKTPDAAWFTMVDDSEITFEEKPIQAKDVKIGSTVKAWSEGMMLASYPGQTGGLRLNITAWDDGKGDSRGTVTGLEKTGEGVNEQRTINVDGVKYRLLPFTKVWHKDENVNASDIKAGDQVKLWFAGYEVGLGKIVSQIIIES